MECNAPDGKGGYKSCGRFSEEKKNTLHVGQPRVDAKKEAKAKVGAKKDLRGKRNETYTRRVTNIIKEELDAVGGKASNVNVRKKPKEKTKKDACYHK